jgi:GAF domain-containing protein
VVFATRQCLFRSVASTPVEKLKEGWSQAQEGLHFAINFLRSNAGIEDESLLSSPMFLHAIAALSRVKDNRLTADEQRQLLHWLLVANARGRYSRGSTETLLNEDLAIIFRTGNVAGLMEPVKRQFGRLHDEQLRLPAVRVVSAVRGRHQGGRHGEHGCAGACFYARRTLELAVDWLYKHDRGAALPYQDHLSALIHEPTFRQVVGDALFTKAKLIKDLGNLAVHSTRKVRPPMRWRPRASCSTSATGWRAPTASGRGLTQACSFQPGAAAQGNRRPAPEPGPVAKLEAQLHERDEKLSTLLGNQAALDAELQALREQVAAAKKANAAQPDTHDYSEAAKRATTSLTCC